MNHENHTVAVFPCATYAEKEVKEALRFAISAIGGFEPYIQKGSRVLLKVNLILAKKPDRHATTHPSFVKALAELLTEYGAEVLIGDSPGGPFNLASLKHVYRQSGMEALSAETGFALNENTGSMEVANPEGVLLKRLTMTAMLRDVDAVISVSKLKTHSMMTFTGAAKNMFGTIPGTVKADYHVRMPKEADFANALLDVCEAASPVLSFMDAIVGMEGNGPTAGTSRKIGAVLCAPNPYALDDVACSMIGLCSDEVPMLREAQKRGLFAEDTIVTKGTDPKQFYIADYKLPDHIQTDLYRMKLPEWVAKPLTKLTRAKVQFDPKRCIGCGVCAANCPPEALRMEGKGQDKRPRVDHKQCIRCFCCQELCPKEAVSVRESVIFRIANKL